MYYRIHTAGGRKLPGIYPTRLAALQHLADRGLSTVAHTIRPDISTVSIRRGYAAVCNGDTTIGYVELTRDGWAALSLVASTYGHESDRVERAWARGCGSRAEAVAAVAERAL
ncbi:hypothetical protein [Microbacterium sp. No. 7]|uniref:hypothetical protein n=1 Tax=Microbacterium sp. No. 7 TaxID=1714373 RepID=UPI0006D0D486|nr:hypothetical protein [Microbacterium sp. No. 7]ALJ22056.1 hypothetical protein AOA12_20040 [Microbacterium sp. No. 7]